MKRFALLSVLLLLTTFVPAAAQTTPPVRKEYFQGLPLCLPDAYPQEPDRCLPLGPSSTLTANNAIGLSIPPAPFPVRALPTNLGSVPYQYLLMSEKSVPVFGSLSEATANRSRRDLPAGKKYLAYTQRVENNNGVFYQFQTGEWIRGESVSSRVGYSSDPRGAQITGVPRTTFGWMIEGVETLTAPGVKGKPSGHKIPIYSMVWAYETRKVDGYDWTMVGPNEWVEERLVAKVIYNPVPQPEVTTGRWVEINLAEQTVSVYDKNQLVFAALAATGIDKMATRPGVFQVTKKVPAEHMTGAFEADRSDFYYLESVPWTVYFDDARAIHGVYWRTSYGRPASHGCVNLTIPDSRWLYDWIQTGDYVYAWDARLQK